MNGSLSLDDMKGVNFVQDSASERLSVYFRFHFKVCLAQAPSSASQAAWAWEC